MAKVSLRIYNREIENMVDRGELDEAIAHCRHILNTFPKNLETYRLLGKAYLEARRYDEATDIFERLLMAVPNDFVAHVGMSIISDEQNDLDAAIWHMERAFEVQPSNAAIQAELQRLFGRRDGVEPPKIRLTRGALAHMYLQGELYPQAISEIKAVLDEDRERQDMQVLLARAYFHAGQKNEAAEMCSQLLRRYPYCLDANRVLVELLPETERGESTQVYRQRVNELDPYAAFVSGSIFRSEEVPDAAVSLERLEWDGQPVDLGQDWRESRGIGLADQTTASDEEPDWLKAGLSSGSLSASLPTEEAASSSDDDIPEFLREAGWGRDTGAYKEGPGIVETSDEGTEEPELAEGDLPDWIKAMAPSGAGISTPTPKDAAEEDLTQDDVPDWLQGLGDIQDTSAGEQPLEQGDLPDWLAAMKPVDETPQSLPEEELSAGPGDDQEIPDWIAALKPVDESQPEPQPDEESMAEPSGDEEPPDWLASLKSAEEVPQETRPEEGMAEPSTEQELPDWISALKPPSEAEQEPQPVEPMAAEPSGEEELPDWLRSIQAEEGKPAPEEPMQGIPEVTEESLSDWQIREEETAGPVAFDATDTGNLGTSSEEQDDAIAWLEGLAAKHGAKPEELVTKPEERTETEPEWVQQARAFKEHESVEAPGPLEEPLGEPTEELPDFLPGMPAEPAEELSAEAKSVESLGTSASEQDDAIAWLESLAAKHGAKPEELVTDPQARKETAPEWVQKAAEAASTEHPPSEEPAPLEEEPRESIPEWIEPAREEPGTLYELGDTQPHKPVPPAGADETGIWLRELEEEGGLTSEQPPVGEPESLVMDANVPDWLRGMEADIPKAETAPTPEEPEEKEQEVPDWLSELEAGPAQAEAGPPASEEAPEVPDWLLGIESEPSEAERFPVSESVEEISPVEAAPTFEQEAQEIPDWLSGIEEEPSEAEIFPAPPAEEETVVESGQEVEFQAVEAAAKSAEPDFTDWLKSVEPEEVEKEGAAAEETVAMEKEQDDFPSWLAGLEEKEAQPEAPAAPVDEGLPEWLRGVDEEKPAHAEPTAPTDWQPAENEAPVFEEFLEEPTSEPEQVMEEPAMEEAPPAVSEPLSELELQSSTPPEREPYQEPVTQSRSDMPAMFSSAKDPALTQAQLELTRGNVSGALDHYEKLIRRGRMLDEIIFDLREALYRYPVDVSILQALGDAYMRANRLQDALDAYTKAEELLR